MLRSRILLLATDGGASSRVFWPGWRTNRGRDGHGRFPLQQRHELVALARSRHTGHVLGRCFRHYSGDDLLEFLRWLLPQLPAEDPLPSAVDFLAGFSGRVQLYFTLTRASWLNQIELWLGLLQ